MFELVENWLYAYNSTLLAVVSMQADRPAVTTSLNRDLARIQEWCNHLSMILNHKKKKAKVGRWSRTVNPPYSDLVLYGASIQAGPNLDNFGVKFDSKLTFEDHMRGIVCSVYQKICILRFAKRIFVDISVTFFFSSENSEFY